METAASPKSNFMSSDVWHRLIDRFKQIRTQSEQYCAPLTIEDYGLQAIVETSPAKWHLAHTTWFFETFILRPYMLDYRAFNPHFEYLFNSYYNGIGAQLPRGKRGLLSRPGVEEIYQYRAYVNDALIRLLERSGDAHRDEVMQRVTLGLHHELQHQELFFTDLKYNLFCNPLYPAYQELTGKWLETRPASTVKWFDYDGGVRRIGCNTKATDFNFDDFIYDNESPQHQVFLSPFRLASRPVTNGEYLEFIEDGGYQNPNLWLSDGWTQVQSQQWRHPLYWQQNDHGWQEFTLYGLQTLDPARSICHLSAYEADAFARWSGARLPTEFEWECAARQQTLQGHFAANADWHPTAASEGNVLSQLFGSVWEWTSSSYGAYPGFQPASGAVGEYNGKFMCNQLVLRGGSCVSDQIQLRPTYRNFFYPPDRWQFSGLRLAKNGDSL